MAISIEDVMKLELKVAQIETAEPHPDADRLYKLGISIGDEKRTIVAGIRAHYDAEDLPGKKIIVIANLEPAVIRGVESQGMLLAASDDDGLSLVVPERAINSGAKVR